MYYTISSTIGSTINVDGIDLVCGQSYAKKTNAKKDDEFVLAYHKDTDVVGNWIFDGQATLNYSEFCKYHITMNPTTFSEDYGIQQVMASDLFLSAWRSAKIEIQAEIRPSKDSAKALRKAEKDIAVLDITAQHVAGDIDDAEFGRLAIELVNKYN